MKRFISALLILLFASVCYAQDILTYPNSFVQPVPPPTVYVVPSVTVRNYGIQYGAGYGVQMMRPPQMMYQPRVYYQPYQYQGSVIRDKTYATPLRNMFFGTYRIDHYYKPYTPTPPAR
ncbi:MAG: hypothetical protein NWE83_05545 [Candidatus Bathyarchaeota archaeon]|nr:hypothetical protein [Candidatus Bathyarchaeota archaeon]